MDHLPSSNVEPTSATVTKKQNNVLFSGASFKNMFLMAACFFAFAAVMTLLVLYMDNTMAKQYQFRKKMSQDYELFGVAQDDPMLVRYVKEMQLGPAIEPHHKPLESPDLIPPSDTAYILKLLDDKKDGMFVEAGAYADGWSSKTEYLEKRLRWRGLLLQPDPTHYFKLKRHNRNRSQAIHACLSSTPYPKEVTYHQEDRDGVKVNSVHANTIEDSDWFNTRVKCFPLYTLLLAINSTNVDLLVLESGGTELQVLQTVPFEKVNIEVINVRLMTTDLEKDTIKKFLSSKNYVFMQSVNGSDLFQLSHVKV